MSYDLGASMSMSILRAGVSRVVARPCPSGRFCSRPRPRIEIVRRTDWRSVWQSRAAVEDFTQGEEDEDEDEEEGEAEETEEPKRASKRRKRKERSKRFKELALNLPEGEVSALEAFGILKDRANAKFDETVEMHGKTTLDPRYADQQLRATGAAVQSVISRISV